MRINAVKSEDFQMSSLLKDLNELSGLFLLLIGFAVGSGVRLLAEIKSEVECLHNDFNTIHDTHRRREPNP